MIDTKCSTGIEYLDHLIGGLRIGDNIIWETDAGAYIELFIEKFASHSLATNSDLIYVSFNRSPATMVKKLSSLPRQENITLLDCFTSGKGNKDYTFTRFYESDDQQREKIKMNVIWVENPGEISHFAKTLNEVEEKSGEGARYIFDSMTGMQDLWGSEEKTYKFFTFSCPRLYDLNTVAYWILEREAHASSFKANLEHVTQVALEVSHTGGQLFLKLTKAENRQTPNIFRILKFEVWEDEIVFHEALEREFLDLGGKVKSLRLKRGLTQYQLAEKLGVTASYISQLERNIVSPSINSLIMIMDELQTNPAYLFSLYKSDPQKIVCRKSQYHPFPLTRFKEDKVKCQLAVNTTENRRMQPMLVTIEPNSDLPGHLFSHKGDEFILILKGELEMDMENDKHLLREGDSIYLDSSTPTSWRNAGEVPVQAVWILSPPMI